MAGWNLKSGEMDKSVKYEKAITQFFSKQNIMKNLYKLLLFKSILQLDEIHENILFDISINFAEFYFIYKTKYPINITIYNGYSKKSTLDMKVENLYKYGIDNYKKLPIEKKVSYIEDAQEVLKKNVIGAFYTSLKKVPYSFNLEYNFIELNLDFKKFLDRNKEKLNEIIELRIIEFLKISEKDERILSKILEKENLISYQQDLYPIIDEMISDLKY